MESLVLRWLALLSLLLPAAFRERFAGDLLLAFEDSLRDRAHGNLALLFWVFRASLVLLRTAAAEHFQPTIWHAAQPSPVPEMARGQLPSSRQRFAYGTNRSKGTAMDRLAQDLRFALRSLGKRPGYVMVAVLTLALGLGANTAIFSVVDAVILRPLPYSNPDRLVVIERVESRQPTDRRAMSRPDIDDVRAQADSFSEVVAYFDTTVTLTGSGEPEVLQSAEVSGDLLRLFELDPVRGRDLQLSDQGPGTPLVVLLGHELWTTRFGASDDVIGQLVQLDEQSYEVVGVAPPGFAFPSRSKLWTNLQTDPEECGRGCHLTRAIARLAPGSLMYEAEVELSAIAARLEREHPQQNRGKTFVATPLATKLVGEAREGLLILLGAVGLVLLIAAANLASLQLARGVTRRSEMGVRSALGASHGRLMRLLLSETLLLGLLGGVAGLVFAFFSLRLVLSIAPEGIPRLQEAAVDPRILVFGLALAVVVTIGFGLYPAWRIARVGRAGGIGAVRRTTSDRSEVRLRTGLLIGEIALSLALLVGSGLLLRTYVGLLTMDLGFDRDGVISFFLAVPDARYDHPDKVVALFDALETELEALPAVESVGGILGRPFSGNTIGTTFHLQDLPQPREGEEPDTRMRVVMPGYFATLRIPLERGRRLDERDRHGALPVALVNETFVRRHSSDRDPLGRQIELGASFGYEEPVRTIVGVVRDVRGESLTRDPEPEVYVPQAQMGSVWMSVVMRTRTDELPWLAVQQAVHRVDPLLPLNSKETLSQAVDRAQGPTRFYFVLLACFAGIAVALAAIGLYGIISYLVTRRSRELAVRLALGADRRAIFGLVIAQGMRPVALGAALGLSLALVAARALSSLLHSVAPFDPLTYLTVTLLLALVAFGALLGPARRAGRVAPARVLEED